MKTLNWFAMGLLGLGLAAFVACSSDDTTGGGGSGGTGATGATGANGGTSQGGTTAQGGQAQGGQAQGGQAQGGQPQGGQGQGGQAQGGQGQGGFVSGTECQPLCSAAQAGQCTAIGGDCGDFCTALLAVAPTAGCDDEATTYLDCLGEPLTVCNANCDTESTDLETCLTIYCAAHQSNTDCGALADAYGIGG